jgi:hypothetical protein
VGSVFGPIRFLLPVTEKNATKNILDGRTDRGKTVYSPPPSGSGGIIIMLTMYDTHFFTLKIDFIEGYAYNTFFFS